jgi:hypothetical protein
MYAIVASPDDGIWTVGTVDAATHLWDAVGDFDSLADAQDWIAERMGTIILAPQ